MDNTAMALKIQKIVAPAKRRGKMPLSKPEFEQLMIEGYKKTARESIRLEKKLAFVTREADGLLDDY